MARRYCCRPSDLLNVSMPEWAINFAVAKAGNEQDKKDER
jgi:hypothetical protein